MGTGKHLTAFTNAPKKILIRQPFNHTRNGELNFLMILHKNLIVESVFVEEISVSSNTPFFYF